MRACSENVGKKVAELKTNPYICIEILNYHFLLKTYRFMKTSILRVAMLLLCVCGSLSSFGQNQTEGKKTVYVDYFSRSSDIPFTWVEELRSDVLEGIQQLNRVNLIDVDTQDALKVEKKRRESGNLSADGDMSRLSQMSELGANYILQGTVTSFTTKESPSSDGKRMYYDASCSYTLKVIDPKNGTTVATKTFKHGQGIADMNTLGDTKDEAASKVANYAKKAVRALVDEVFKLNGTILEISEEKNGEAKQVYVSLGSDHGVNNKTSLKVYVKRTVAGRASRKEIGELKAVAVEGGDLTLCDVKKGGKEIKDAMDAKQDIEVESFHKQSLFDKAKGAVNKI